VYRSVNNDALRERMGENYAFTGRFVFLFFCFSLFAKVTFCLHSGSKCSHVVGKFKKRLTKIQNLGKAKKSPMVWYDTYTLHDRTHAYYYDRA